MASSRDKNKIAHLADPCKAGRCLRLRLGDPPRLALVLGSGFGWVLERWPSLKRVSCLDIPGFGKPKVEGHPGECHLVDMEGVPVWVLSGRTHFYEGHEMAQVTFPVRALASAGVKDLLLTNAAGGIHATWQPGEFMVVTDHINLMGSNPLRGAEVSGMSRFVDLTQAYDPDLRRLLCKAGRRAGIRLRTGVYLAVSGPSYETAAEIRAFSRLGADAVGMSTVPEVIVARQCGMRVAAISCITNLAAGLGGEPLSHAEVLRAGKQAKAAGCRWLGAFFVSYAKIR